MKRRTNIIGSAMAGGDKYLVCFNDMEECIRVPKLADIRALIKEGDTYTISKIVARTEFKITDRIEDYAHCEDCDYSDTNGGDCYGVCEQNKCNRDEWPHSDQFDTMGSIRLKHVCQHQNSNQGFIVTEGEYCEYAEVGDFKSASQVLLNDLYIYDSDHAISEEAERGLLIIAEIIYTKENHEKHKTK